MMTSAVLMRQLTILNTGPGSNFVRVNTLPPGWESLVTPEEIPKLADANYRPLRTSRQIELVVRLVNCTMSCNFIVFKRLAAPIILGCAFNDKFVDEIYLRRKIVELDDGKKVQIVRKPARCAVDSPPLSSEQDYSPQARCRALRGMRWDPPRQSSCVRRARWWVVERPPVRDRYGAGREAQ